MCASIAFQAVGCGTDNSGDAPPTDAPPVIPDPDDPPPPPPPAIFSTRASRSSTIAISDDDSLVAMTNPDDGSISVFTTSDNSRLSKIATGANPSSIVIAGDGKTAYVANRNDGTVTRVININGGTPKADDSVQVGAEPVGLALAPSGTKLFVAEFAESRVSIIDTATMSVVSSVTVDRPRALVVTNNKDQNDSDEQLLVSQFFGVPVEGKEGQDDSRTGRILKFSLANVSEGSGTAITLAPTATGFAGAALTSPNQLAAMAVTGSRVYITSVSASPKGPAAFNSNVFPVVYVADFLAGTEVRDNSGTANLAQKVVALVPQPNPRFIPGDLSDIAFLDDSQVAYTVSKAGDLMLRLQYGTNLAIGAMQNAEINLIGNSTIGSCQAPIGLVVSKTLGRGYVNCWVTRRLAVVSFESQTLTQTFEASPAPVGATETQIQKGKRFYFTGRARWSNAGANGAVGGEGWSSCGSCHPDGLTDNITWIFGSGPRQTTSMDGSFSHSPGVGPQKQRMFNWTAVNDEMHDFELNTRNVSGGVGAITTGDCSSIDKETAIAPIAPLGASAKDLADGAPAGCKRTDWDDINAFVKTIAPVHASKLADSQAIESGRTLFKQGNCANCHGGAGWTISRRPYDPRGGTAVTLQGQAFAQSVFKSPFMFDDLVPRNLVSGQPALGQAVVDPAEPAVGVLQLACVLRNVGTFGVPSIDPSDATANAAAKAATDLLEVRAAGADRAQGRAGYNTPSLYGLALGAPYLHHGQAASLEDLFTNPKWNAHTNAGNPNFFLSLSGAGLSNLTKFLLSIDASTEEFNIPTLVGGNADVCPGTPGQSPGL